MRPSRSPQRPAEAPLVPAFEALPRLTRASPTAERKTFAVIPCNRDLYRRTPLLYKSRAAAPFSKAVTTFRLPQPARASLDAMRPERVAFRKR